MKPREEWPDFVMCIQHPRADVKTTLCGRALFGWVFTSIDHAFCTRYVGGYQMVCPDCVAKIEFDVYTGEEE